MRALFLLTLRQMLGGKKIWFLAAFLSLPLILLAIILLASGFDFPEDDQVDVEGILMSGFLYLMYPHSLCILGSLLYGASLLAGEIEEKTLTYLFTRSLPRWKVLLGKYLATASVLALMCTASMSLAYLLCGLPYAPQTWLALVVTTVAACFAYTALFCLLGLFVPRRAIPVGLIYAAVVEGLLSTVPAVVNELTISYYLRSLGWRIADLPVAVEPMDEFQNEIVPLIAGASIPAASLALAVMTLLGLALSALTVHQRQWPLTEGV